MIRSIFATCVVFLFVLLSHNVFAQEFDWAVKLGNSDNDYARDVVTDAAGNVYITGFFSGTVDFDPGTGTQNLTSSGGLDVFVLKLNASGGFGWAKSIGGTGTDAAYAIDLDGLGNIYVAGRFQGTVDFNPGSGTYNLTSAGNADAFVLKLDASGNFRWAAAMGGTSLEQPNGLAVDALGNVYTAGVFSGTADFDPGSGTHNLSSAGGEDFFVQKLDSAGNLVWAHGFGSTAADRAYGLTQDLSGNIYVTGIFSGTVDFNPGISTNSLTSAGFFDVFVLKLDSSGNYLWANNFGGTSYDFGWNILTDAEKNVYTAGYFQGTADFDPGTGTHSIQSVGSYDWFIQKSDSNGNFIWAKSSGGAGDDRGYSMFMDDSSYLYMTGYFQQTADFDPGQDSFKLSVYANSEAFLLKLDTAGAFYWAGAVASTGSSFGLNLTVDNKRSIYVAGNFDGTADFNPDPSAVRSLASAGNSDGFVLKMKQCVTYSFNQMAACDSFISPSGKKWVSSGNYIDTIPNAANCDSIISISLTIMQTYRANAAAAICAGDSIMLGGKWQTKAGKYVDTVLTNSACDSITTTTLTVNPVYATQLSREICMGDSIFLGGAYRHNANIYYDTLQTLSGCDSIISTSLTVNPVHRVQRQVNICTGDSFFVQGAYQIRPGIYFDTLTAFTGCDSIVETTLDTVPQILITASAGICKGDSLFIGGAYRTSAGVYYDTLKTFSGCDSVIITTLAVHENKAVMANDSICKGDSIFLAGAWQTTAGSYQDNYQTSFGCDSMVITTLKVNEVDTSVIVYPDYLSANATGASFRWFLCENDTFIYYGDDYRIFPTYPASFAVEVTQNGCVDTSACIYVQAGSIEEQQQLQLKLFPNPTTSDVTIAFEELQKNIVAEVVSTEGKTLLRKNFTNQSSFQLNMDNYSPGIYFIKITTAEGVAVRKVSRQ